MKLHNVLFLLLLLCLCGQGAFGQPITLVTVGDSLTAGDGDDGIGGGYPPRLLDRLLPAHPGSVVQNFALSGDTTGDLINKQLTSAIEALNAAPASNLKIALVWIGSNDLFGFYNFTIHQDWCISMGTDACEESEFNQSADNVNTVLAGLKETGAALYIALLDDQSRRPVITDPGLRAATFPDITDEYAARMSTRVSVYNNSVKTHASTHGAATADFFNTTIFENWDTLSDDGNHPNGAGYDAITTIWFNSINGSGAPPPSPPPVIPGSGILIGPLSLLLNENP